MVSEWLPIIQYSGPFRWRRFEEWRPGLVDPAGNGNLIAIRDPALFNRLKFLCRKRAFRKRVLDFLRTLYSRL